MADWHTSPLHWRFRQIPMTGPPTVMSGTFSQGLYASFASMKLMASIGRLYVCLLTMTSQRFMRYTRYWRACAIGPSFGERIGLCLVGYEKAWRGIRHSPEDIGLADCLFQSENWNRMGGAMAHRVEPASVNAVPTTGCQRCARATVCKSRDRRNHALVPNSARTARACDKTSRERAGQDGPGPLRRVQLT